ncbi:MAG: PspA/IM30 family protein [Lachnospiraceae bacterium]|nr:PspA/IM30 family protein [Lachnospiraceae bacterium]
MGILSRFKDIMSANINALLDKAEDPEKMIDQYLRNIESDLGKVKAETAAVMAEETRCKRKLDECNAEINKYQTYAEKAVVAGNDDDARQFLAKKSQLETERASLQQSYEVASANAAKMRQMHDKLTKDIADLNARKDAIKAKVAAAKTQEKMNKLAGSVSSTKGTMSAFDRMEAKADSMLDKANAMAELNSSAEEADISNLAAKYDSAASTASSPAVDDELAALKAKMGL